VNLNSLKAEIPAADRIPYTALLSDYTLVTDAGEYLQVLRLAGASFESADDEEINNWHVRLNVTLRNIGSPHIMLYQHIIRREDNTYPTGRFPAGSFAEDLDMEYRKKLAHDTLMVNDLYLTIMYKPLSSLMTKYLYSSVRNGRGMPASVSLRFWALFGLHQRAIEEGLARERAEALEYLDKTV
jgi:type IV secretion system protein VirB4